MFTYEPLQCFPEKTVKVFQYDLDWLKEKIKEVAGPEWGFVKNNPPTYTPFIQEPVKTINPNEDYWNYFVYLQNKNEFYLDTETWNLKDKNPMSNLGLRTIQIDNHYLIWESLNQEEKDNIIKVFVNKTVYLFNLNLDVSQLKYAGFNIEANKWFDIALLARVCENRLMEKLTFSLNNLALNVLGSSTKEDLIEKLEDKLKVRSKDALFALKGLVYERTSFNVNTLFFQNLDLLLLLFGT
jgi:hypothetical protein